MNFIEFETLIDNIKMHPFKILLYILILLIIIYFGTYFVEIAKKNASKNIQDLIFIKIIFLIFGIKKYQNIKKEITKKEQEDNELKEKDNRKIFLIKDLLPSQKEKLRLFDDYNRSYQFLWNKEIDDMVKKDILEPIGDRIPVGPISKAMTWVLFKITSWALEIITKYPEVLN